MTPPRFSCSLRFAHSWRATPEEIDALLGAMISSFSASGVEGLDIGGNIELGTLNLSFFPPANVGPADDEDSLDGVALVVRALNRGRVSAPGWPSDEVIEDAIASVIVKECALV
jgi:hypothetical protein